MQLEKVITTVKKKNTAQTKKKKDKATNSLWYKSYNYVFFINKHFNFDKDVLVIKNMGLAKASELMVNYGTLHVLAREKSIQIIIY